MTHPLQPLPILQTRLTFAPWHIPQGQRLPGTGMCDPCNWLQVDEAYAAQMALRDRLLDKTPDAVRAGLPEAAGAQRELLGTLLEWLGARSEFAVGPAGIIRPDGTRVAIDCDNPLETLGRLVQQDLCILQPGEDGEHRLTAAILCFPSYWSLSEKLGRPLTGIHVPVPRYDSDVARRVQRLFDFLRPGMVLERANCLPQHDWAIVTPAREGDRHAKPGPDAAYFRLERQTLCRLPVTGAVIFAIHTAMLERRTLSETDRAAVARHLGAADA